jgi:hypothetical protein
MHSISQSEDTDMYEMETIGETRNVMSLSKKGLKSAQIFRYERNKRLGYKQQGYN